ncbi:MAG: diguanylate cyclase domain-containing protein, partial [Solirubrobacteraceae bacterium]
MPVVIGFISGAILGAVAMLFLLRGSGGARAEVDPTGEAVLDPVTGLATHDRLQADLERELEGGSEVTLYLFALDGFKDYNDAYGDVCGDALLGWLGRKLRDAVGSYGIAYRMRGGSFALLAVGSERFTNALCATAASALNETGDGFQISCDVGSASLPSETALAREGLELAARRATKASGERHVKSGRRAPSDAIEALRLVRSRQD